MTQLVLINGAPGTGKSTVAQRLAQDTRLALALNIDLVKHSLGQWEADATGAGVQARRLALAMADEHVSAGYHVIIGQYLAKTAFIEQVECLAQRRGADFIEFVLVLDDRALLSRLERRALQPDRSEHEVNARLVSAGDVPELVRSMERLLTKRPSAISIDASGTPEDTVGLIRRHLSSND